MLVLRDLVVLLGLLERLHAVAAHVAHGDAALLGVFVRELGELVAALRGELGDRDADHLAVRRRVEAEAGVADRLGGRRHQALVPDADGQQARLGRAHRADLVERHALAVGLDLHRVEQVDRGAAGAQAGELLLQRVHRAVHALLEFLEVCAHFQPSSLMMVWVPLPAMVSANEPGLWMSNTMIGILFSRARQIAEASITCRSCCSTSM